MDLTKTSTLPEPAKVISLNLARNKYRPDKCRHRHMTVDEDLNTVQCDDCGAQLNPVAVLMRFATEESRWAQQAHSLRELHKKLDARPRCKCQHFGRMTQIRL